MNRIFQFLVKQNVTFMVLTGNKKPIIYFVTSDGTTKVTVYESRFCGKKVYLVDLNKNDKTVTLKGKTQMEVNGLLKTLIDNTQIKEEKPAEA